MLRRGGRDILAYRAHVGVKTSSRNGSRLRTRVFCRKNGRDAIKNRMVIGLVREGRSIILVIIVEVELVRDASQEVVDLQNVAAQA